MDPHDPHHDTLPPHPHEHHDEHCDGQQQEQGGEEGEEEGLGHMNAGVPVPMGVGRVGEGLDKMISQDFNTQHKFNVIELCFRTFTVPAPGKVLKYADFYPLFYASTPPSAWHNIAWIGRHVRKIVDSFFAFHADSSPSHLSSHHHHHHHNPHHASSMPGSLVDVALPDVDPVVDLGHVDLHQAHLHPFHHHHHQQHHDIAMEGVSHTATMLRKRKRDEVFIMPSSGSSSSSPSSSLGSGKKLKAKKEVLGFQLVDQLDLNNLSKDALVLKELCEMHSIVFLTSVADERVATAREIIDLYYQLVRSNTKKPRNLDMLEMLKSALGYSNAIDIESLRESINTECIVSWRGSNLIEVPKNSFHPPFIVYYSGETLSIEISTFHLRYSIEIERNVLYVMFSLNEEHIAHAEHFSSGLIAVGSNKFINSDEKHDRFQMIINLPPNFDEETVVVNRKDDFALVLTVKEGVETSRRKIICSDQS